MSLTMIFITALSGSIALAEDRPGFDQGFVKGLKPAMSMLIEYTSGSGDIDYHIRSFDLRRNFAGRVAVALEKKLGGISNALLKTSLKDLAQDIKASPQQGRGGINFWTEMLKQQNSALRRVSQRFDALLERTISDPVLSNDRELGYLEGLHVGVGSIVDSSSARGDTDYFIRSYEISRNVANFAARDIEAELKNVENSFLRYFLDELAKDIRSAPQKGKGDLDFWANTMPRHQETIYRRADQKLASFIKLVDATYGSGVSNLPEDCQRRFDGELPSGRRLDH